MEALDTESGPEATSLVVMTSNGVIAMPHSESPAESRHKAKAAVQTCLCVSSWCCAFHARNFS